MDKAIKFLFQTIFGCFILWTAIGDFYTTMQNSHKTYDNIKATVEDFNRLPESDKTTVFVVGALVAGGVVYGIHKSKS